MEHWIKYVSGKGLFEAYSQHLERMNRLSDDEIEGASIERDEKFEVSSEDQYQFYGLLIFTGKSLSQKSWSKAMDTLAQAMKAMGLSNRGHDMLAAMAFSQSSRNARRKSVSRSAERNFNARFSL